MPTRPRVERRRRGDDFFANFERAIAAVFAGDADVFLHGGDVFFRSKIPAWLADRVFQRLADIADSGTEVFIVPGNHERSAMPRSLFLTHPGVRVFDTPRTFIVERKGLRISLSGFPYTPSIRDEFPSLLEATHYREKPADVRLLCMHQLIEGARVGPSNFTFRSGEDVLPGSSLPQGFAAVLSGHVHRHQVLENDLRGNRLNAPVLYPGSIERTSFAERFESKGSLLLEFGPVAGSGGRLLRREFRELPVRPMVDLEMPTSGVSGSEFASRLREAFLALSPESLVRIRLHGNPGPGVLSVLCAESLRSLTPSGMSVSVAWPFVRSSPPQSLPPDSGSRSRQSGDGPHERPSVFGGNITQTTPVQRGQKEDGDG